MSEVTQQSTAYQNKLPSTHTLPTPLNTTNKDSSASSPASLPPLHTNPVKQSLSASPSPSTSSNNTPSTAATPSSAPDANPPHPNAKSTTQITSNGSTTTKSNISTPVCKNCKTSTTPLWRRDESGQVLCNACGLFLKLHGRPRPISLKTDVIKSRNRVKNGQNNHNHNHNNGRLEIAEHRPKDRRPSPKPNSSNEPFQEVQMPPQYQNQQNVHPASGNVTSPGLVPLLPRNAATPGKLTPNFGPQFHHHLPPHLQQQVPLHHPSSVPTQFASNLNAITSPLLLSTTVKTKVQSHHLSQAHIAAGTLENLSQSNDHNKMSELSKDELNLNDRSRVQPFSPASALSGNGISNGGQGSVTKLPSLMNPVSNNNSTFYSSPSFGPQHSLTNPSAFSLLNGPHPPQPEQVAKPPSGNEASQASQAEEIIRLKNRISELELVNDLYKTRIMELENLEAQSKEKEQEKEKEKENERERENEQESNKKHGTVDNEDPAEATDSPATKKIKLEDSANNVKQESSV